MKKISFALVAIALVNNTCYADRGGSRVYARSQLNCNPAAGAIGAVVGGALDLAIRGKRSSPGEVLAVAGITGLAAYGLSCKEEVVYMEKVDRHLYDRDYRRKSYRDNEIEVTVLRSGYNQRRQVCRTYFSEIQTRHGTKTQESTACWEKNEWRHGYEKNVIIEESYSNKEFSRRHQKTAIEPIKTAEELEMEEFRAWKAQRNQKRDAGSTRSETRFSSTVTRSRSLDDGFDMQSADAK